MEQKDWKRCLESGELDAALTQLYGGDGLTRAKERCGRVVEGFERTFGACPEALFSAPGRTELGGNHTDHQHGRVLAASVDMDILSAVRPNESGLIRVQSEGYPLITVELSRLTPQSGEENTSTALIRGVCAKMAELGCELAGKGLDAYMISDVLGGSGLSSSAAFEVLVGTILNDLFFGGKCSAVEIAQIGQYAENVFFGKPCGLMDQAASSVGGVVFIDFKEPAHPVVERVDYDFSRSGYTLCIVDTRSSHGDLTDDYAAITREMGAVAAHFGKTVLREVKWADFRAALPALRRECGDRAVLRALHFFEDDRRAAKEAAALKNGDFEFFLVLVEQSGLSSALHLQNTWSIHDPAQQAVPLALAEAESLLDRGAVRVHGGGFAGTIQAWVPNEELTGFKAGMEALLGEGSCHVLRIRPVGGVRLA